MIPDKLRLSGAPIYRLLTWATRPKTLGGRVQPPTEKEAKLLQEVTQK